MMKPTWIRKTDGDPLSATRQLLFDLWRLVDLQGILAPVYKTSYQGVGPELIEDPDHLKIVDPYCPFVSLNSAIAVEQLVKNHPLGRFGVVLRSCEARALQQMVLDDRLSVENLFIIGVDCLGSFPIDEFGWRYQKEGALDQISRESLQFSRQGGIAPYRFRTTCQICSSPADGNVDLRIGIIGLPSIQLLLIILENERLIEQVDLSKISNTPADVSLLDQRQRLLKTVIERHQCVQTRMMDNLRADFPHTLNELRALLARCAPCRKCLDACAIYQSEKNICQDDNLMDTDYMEHWIVSCVSCGMCEQACPQHLPLPMIIKNIRTELMHEMAH
jgi:formate dehydrogenase (coenzyme F420) beta subunit